MKKTQRGSKPRKSKLREKTINKIIQRQEANKKKLWSRWTKGWEKEANTPTTKY